MQHTDRIDSLTSGSELQGYMVERVLGSGAFGITYLAKHRHLGSLHVIKEYLPDCAMREHNRSTVSPKSASDKDLFAWGLKCFSDEAKLLHQLSHPHIVKVTDLFEANGTAYFVMPYLQGITLHEWMKRHPQPSQDELEAIFVPLLEGLKYIHDKNLLHRDIKPENVYILENGHPILIDFGSARIAIGHKSKALTQVLTPHFAPHEQYRTKGTFTPALDLYGIAACMYQAITGKLPEEAPNRIEEDLQPKLAGSVYENTYAPSFLRAIDKSLSVYAKERHQDGFDLQKDLVGREAVSLDGSGESDHQVDVKTDHVSSKIVPEETNNTISYQSDHYEETKQSRNKKRRPSVWIGPALAILIIVGIFWTMSDQINDFQCIDGDCIHGFGTLLYNDGEKYVGEFKDGNFHGQGTWTHPDGDRYDGEFKDDKRHGQGTWTHPDGHKYVGEWKDDLPNGHGTETFPDGVEYVGEFKDDEFHGQGTWTHPDGQKYVGEWKDGLQNGQGTKVFPDGDEYVGEFKDGYFHGQGTYTFADGSIYIGEFKEDNFHGHGTWTDPDGHKYVGEFKDDNFHGQGTWTDPDGYKYVGEFRDDKFHGHGTAYNPDGSVVFVGQWRNDQPVQ